MGHASSVLGLKTSRSKPTPDNGPLDSPAYARQLSASGPVEAWPSGRSDNHARKPDSLLQPARQHGGSGPHRGAGPPLGLDLAVLDDICEAFGGDLRAAERALAEMLPPGVDVAHALAARRDQRSHPGDAARAHAAGASSSTQATSTALSQHTPLCQTEDHAPSAPPLPPDLLSLMDPDQAGGAALRTPPSAAPRAHGLGATTTADRAISNRDAPGQAGHPIPRQEQHHAHQAPPPPPQANRAGAYANVVGQARPAGAHASTGTRILEQGPMPVERTGQDARAHGRWGAQGNGAAQRDHATVAGEASFTQGSGANARSTTLAGAGADAVAASGGTRAEGAARDHPEGDRDGDRVEALPRPGSLRVYDIEELGSGRDGVAEDSMYRSGGLFADVLQKAGGDVAKAQAFMRELGISVGAGGSSLQQRGRSQQQQHQQQQQSQQQQHQQQSQQQQQRRPEQVTSGAFPGLAAMVASHAPSTSVDAATHDGRLQQQPHAAGSKPAQPPRPHPANGMAAPVRDTEADSSGSINAHAHAAAATGRSRTVNAAIGSAGSGSQPAANAAGPIPPAAAAPAMASGMTAAAPGSLAESSRQPGAAALSVDGSTTPGAYVGNGPRHSPVGHATPGSPATSPARDSQSPSGEAGMMPGVGKTVPKPGPLRQPLRPGHVFLFGYRGLFKATNGFAESRVLGAGGFGKVFRGELHGMQVAIKLLDSDSMQGEAEFVREVEVLGEYQHENIVRLVGYATDEGRHCLVYEYMDGGSLQDRLAQARPAEGSGASSQPGGRLPALTWRERVALAADCASGLAFLHTGRPRPLVHCDVKSANVLLNAVPADAARRGHPVTLRARIGDVGLCRLGKEIEISTPHGGRSAAVIGSFGYVDPVYMTTGQLDLLNDSFSFGVVLLELITGLPAVSPGLDPPFLSSRLQPCLQLPAQLAAMADKTAGNWPLPILAGLARVASRCLEYSHSKRCSMQDASLALQDLLEQADKIKG